ncbi:hypothetical protein [Luteimonas cucumeris]|uniref:hypothetical protein n=1 Tax=Luteimonas cucumeris TaxID=985012 RepID=UPI0011A4CDEF|nr:hypothetical protein [Luteimonas cucumeris]
MCLYEINWGSVADWVSGIGALTAAIVALYLARRSERIRLKGHCGIMVLFFPGGPKQDVFVVSATNVGTRSTIVNNIGMRVGRFKNKRQAVIGINATLYSAGVPHALADGQTANWHIPLDAEKSWVKDLCGTIVKTKDDVRTLRFVVHTTHGEDLILKPAESVREVLLSTLKGGANNSFKPKPLRGSA